MFQSFFRKIIFFDLESLKKKWKLHRDFQKQEFPKISDFDIAGIIREISGNVRNMNFGKFRNFHPWFTIRPSGPL